MNSATGDPWSEARYLKAAPIDHLGLVVGDIDQAVSDLVSYLTWMGEPAQNQRVRIGVWVLIFLSFFTIIAWRLNAAFWKDIK